tara:strand:- start:679 stop:831 length:153 start_codon:yes stop_codon:yes gene_type:complete
MVVAVMVAKLENAVIVAAAMDVVVIQSTAARIDKLIFNHSTVIQFTNSLG